MILACLKLYQVYDSYVVCDPVELPKFSSALLLFRWLILCVCGLGFCIIITLIPSLRLIAFCFAFTCMYFYLVGFRIPDFPSSPGIGIASSVFLATPAPSVWWHLRILQGGFCLVTQINNENTKQNLLQVKFQLDRPEMLSVCYSEPLLQFSESKFSSSYAYLH